MIFRWFRELATPADKCERRGHRIGVESRAGYVWPEDYRRHVCDRVTQERPFCVRCRTPLDEWKTVSRQGFSGVSWPADMLEKFQSSGEYWDRSWRRT